MAFFDDLFEDPALMALLAGGAIAATGGAAAPAVLGAEAATAGAGGLLAAGGAEAAAGSYAAGALGTAGGYGGMGAATVMPGASTGGGLMGGMSGIANTIKPYGDAAGAAMKVKGLLSDPQQPTPQAQSTAPQVGGGQGSQTLAQIYQQGTQISPEEQARLQRKTMWG